MAIAPAPTAEAILLTDPYLTSPAAKGGGGDSLGGPGGGVFQHEPLEPPPPPTTQVFRRTSTFSAASTSVIRYSDMLEASVSPRTSRVTREAYLERCMAACPAEFPAPTT
jgi:hypothetical protein